MKHNLQELTDYAGRLKAGRIFAKFFKIIFGILLAVCILILLMVVSTGDFQIETKYVPTPQEQHIQNVLYVVCTIGVILSGLLILFCNKINAFIDRELARIRRIYRRRLTRTIQAATSTAIKEIQEQIPELNEKEG